MTKKRSRPLNPAEKKMLGKLLKEKESTLRNSKGYHYFIIAAVVAPFCAWCAASTKNDVLVFILGTVAVFGFGLIVFMPYEIYKIRKELKQDIHGLKAVIENGFIEVWPVIATQIALAEEYEDECDLYIVEINDTGILFIWDFEVNLNRKFPCLNFEIYNDDFFMLTGRQLYMLSEKIKPILVDRKAKWNFMSQYYVPTNLSIEDTNLTDFIAKVNSCK